MLQPAYDQYRAMELQAQRQRRRHKALAIGLAVVLLMVAMGAVCSGCALLQPIVPQADTPLKRWAQQREALTTTTQIYNALARSRVLDDRQIVQFGRLLQEVDGHLERARAQIDAGGGQSAGGGFEEALFEASTLLESVRKILEEASYERSSNRGGDFGRDQDRAVDHHVGAGVVGGLPQAGRHPAPAWRDHRRAVG